MGRFTPRRFGRGSRQGNASLTEAQARAIRHALSTGSATPAELAVIYSTSVESIRRIGRRETWGWLEDKIELPAEPVLTKTPEEAQASLERFLKSQEDAAAPKTPRAVEEWLKKKNG